MLYFCLVGSSLLILDYYSLDIIKNIPEYVKHAEMYEIF